MIISKNTKLQRSKIKIIQALLFCSVVALLVFLVACAPRTSADENANSGENLSQDGNSVVEIDWSTSTDCGACHSVEEASANAIPCKTADQKESNCVICHVSDEAQMIKVHEGVTSADAMPKRLKKTEVSDEICLSCHYETREALIMATDGITVVTDSNGLQINPHNPGSSGTGHTSITCTSCHNWHAEGDTQTRAQAKCESCHHQKVFECNTCHEA